MSKDSCDGCGEEIAVAGGIANFWTFQTEPTGGIVLEFEDGTEHFLCYACIERLPDHPSAADVEALGESATE